MTGSKIEFKLKKATEGLRWEVLENDAPIETTPKPHNSSKDWDKIGKEADEEYKKDVEEGGGEAALQQMFKVSTFIVKTKLNIQYKYFMALIFSSFNLGKNKS